MSGFGRRAVQRWIALGPRFLPFADAASPELPLSRLLRLSLFQVSVGMALVLLVGTLNRVMIVELGVAASIVSVMVAMPVLFAPFRALVGFRSDNHRSELGWRRVPFIWQGTLIQFGGLAIMPFALLVLSGAGEAANAPPWLGPAAAALAFLLVGAGLHITQTVGLALATDLAPPETQPRVVGLMYVMLLVGMIGSALVFGALLVDFTAGRLVQVIQSCAVVTIFLNLIALWKQEARRPGRSRAAASAPEMTFGQAWQRFSEGEQALRRLLAVGVGTMAFSMSDILLEPYGGQVLGLTVASTTRLTAALAFGSLIGFAVASWVLTRGVDALRLAALGALLGIPAFIAVMLAAPLAAPALFVAGTCLLGFGAGLFGHGTLTATMNLAPPSQAGLALGAWGAIQATAAGVGVALSGVLRDLINHLTPDVALPTGLSGAARGYTGVYLLEILLLSVTLVIMLPLLRERLSARAVTPAVSG
jgi:BCD family chlorophyll transporter-like MFS transporter